MRHAEQPGAGGRSPSDVALSGLTQGEIERLESDCGAIEDILPLSPLQEGLLFHALYDAQGPDVYTVQLELELEGALDSALLQASLQAVVGRHASLRAGFRHEHLSRPVQVVLPRVAVPWRLIDLSEWDDEEQQRRLAEPCGRDRLERFDLADPPLMRFALMRLSARAAPVADQQPSPSDGRLVGADPGAGVACGLCGWRQRGFAAAGDAVPRLSFVHRRTGPRGRACGLAGDAGRARGGHAACAAGGGRARRLRPSTSSLRLTGR